MKLKLVGLDHYRGSYRGHQVEISHLARADWFALIDGQPEHFTSLERARAECRRVIDYAADKGDQ
jgi:hypothetical protein